MPLSRRRTVLALLLALPAAAIVLALAAWTLFAMQPHVNPSGQQASDPNERCAPSPCGAPNGFEVDVTAVDAGAGRLVLTLTFRNHTTPQLFEAVGYRHTSPADFTLRAGGRTLTPAFDAGCPNWPELDVQRGASSPPRTLCFDVPTAAGAVLVWNPDLGVVSRPVSIALG